MSRPVHFFKLMLQVSDLERSERFYRDDLGLRFIGRDLWPDDGHTSTFQTEDDGYVVLVEVPEVMPDGPGQHRNFMVPEEDYHRIFQRLKERGWIRQNYRTEMGLRSLGEITCSFFDPDRHRLQLTAWRKPFHVPSANRGKVVAGAVDDFAVGSVTRVQEGKFYLLRTAEGFLALNEICTHLHCIVSYQPEHYQFYCYCHSRRFAQTGEQIALQVDVPPLETYPVEIVDGKVVVDTDHSTPRQDVARTRFMPPPPQGHATILAR